MSPVPSDKLSSIYVPLRLVYGLVPIVAGADKFFNLLTNWSHYIAPMVADRLPISTAAFMAAVGVIEIVAGLLVLTVLPRLGAYIVAIWLLLISVNLILAGFYDVAVRDIVMALGAFVLGQVAAIRGEGWFGNRSLATGTTMHGLAH